jgi:hypothetical protein
MVTVIQENSSSAASKATVLRRNQACYHCRFRKMASLIHGFMVHLADNIPSDAMDSLWSLASHMLSSSNYFIFPGGPYVALVYVHPMRRTVSIQTIWDVPEQKY